MLIREENHVAVFACDWFVATRKWKPLNCFYVLVNLFDIPVKFIWNTYISYISGISEHHPPTKHDVSCAFNRYNFALVLKLNFHLSVLHAKFCKHTYIISSTGISLFEIVSAQQGKAVEQSYNSHIVYSGRLLYRSK